MRPLVAFASLLVASSCAAPPPQVVAPPAAPVVEVPVAPATAGVNSSAPGRTTPPPTAEEPALTLTPAPSGFAGGAGNIAGDSGITGLWAAQSRVFAVGSNFILRSTDRGLHFSRSELPLRFPVVWSSGDEVYVGGEGGVFHSSDGGVTFTKAPGSMGSAVQAVWGRSAEEVYLAGGGDRPFVMKTTDHGATWTDLPTPLAKGWFHGLTGTDNSDVIVTGVDNGAGAAGRVPYGAVIYRSTNGGKSWARLPIFKTGNESEESRTVCFASGVLFASSAYALYATRDLGKTWTLATTLHGEVLTLACRGKEVIVGGRGRELAISSDLGATWTKDPLATLFANKAGVSVQGAAIADTGEAYVGYEGLYDDKRGSLFRRSP